MKICITGAHFTPAQAVIEELKRDPKLEILYIGRNHTIEGDKTPSVESQVLPKLGVKFIPVIAGRVRRYLSFGTFVSLLKIPVGFIQTFWILVNEHPDVVLSFGGYVGVPVVINAWLLNIPVILHEQTLISGLANTVSSFFANKIAVSFDKDYGFKKEKMILTGNPIRKELLEGLGKPSKEVEEMLKAAKSQKKPLIYITGGNQGSHLINEAVLGSLEELIKLGIIIHQAGDSKFNDFEALKEKSKGLEKNYLPLKWVDVEDLKVIFSNADLAISRAGANTLLELAYLGVPTLVIPLPGLYKDEQNENANFFKKIGLCEILPQSELSPKSLVNTVKGMLGREKGLKREAENAKSLVIVDAAKRLALETVLLGLK